MSRLHFVARAADAPRPRRGTHVVVLDAGWTPGRDARSDLLPIRPVVQSILDEVDVVDESLATLDAWAAAAGLPDAFAVDDVAWWNRARMLLRWEVHELVLWRLVLDRLGEGGAVESVTVPVGRPALLAAAHAGQAPMTSEGSARPERGTTVQVTGLESSASRMLGGARRRASRLFGRVRPAPVETTSRSADLERRLSKLAGEQGGVLALAWPRAFQVVRTDDRERRVDPYLVGALDRLAAEGERVVTIGLGLDHRRDEDWALAEGDDRLLPERFLVERGPAGEDIDSTAVTEAVARAAGVPQPLGSVDIGPSLAVLGARYAGRWLDRQRYTLRAAETALGSLQPSALFTDREGSRTAWLAAGRRAGVPSVAIQHGMIYSNSPEYFQPPHPARVRPDVTCVFGEFERALLVGGADFGPDEVVVTGSPRPLGVHAPLDEAERAAVRRELDVRDGDRLLLVSVAHNEVMGELHTFGVLQRTLGGPLPGIHVVFKLHPQDQAAPRHRELLDGLASAGGYDSPRVSIVRDVDLYRLLRAADAHLGQYSTVLSDAVVAGTPNMIAVGQARADPLDYVSAGVATPVRSVEEVRAVLADPSAPSADARQRFLDAHYRAGDPTERLADVLRGAIASRRASPSASAPPVAPATPLAERR